MSKQGKIFIGVVIALAAVVGIFLWTRKASADDNTPDDKQPDEPGPGIDDKQPKNPIEEPPSPPRADPWSPTVQPQKGMYYAVKKGDTMTGILARAGYGQPDRYRAYRAMLTDPRNAWIGTQERPDEKPFAKVLAFVRRFRPDPGHPGVQYTHEAPRLPASQAALGRWPVVYVPWEV